MPCDYSKYPPDWFTAVRPAALARAGNRCQRCGLPQYAVFRYDERGRWECVGGNLWLDDLRYAGSFAEARDVRDSANEDEPGGYRVCVLTIAHLNHDTADNRPENLRALCQRCHLRHDGRLHAANAARTRRAKREAANPPLFALEESGP